MRRKIALRQPPPENPNACANEPNPPRVTPPDAESDEAPDDERLDEESPPKKLLRDDEPPEPPWPPPERMIRSRHSALGCATDAIPGWLGSQFSPGISA